MQCIVWINEVEWNCYGMAIRLFSQCVGRWVSQLRVYVYFDSSRGGCFGSRISVALGSFFIIA